VATQAPSSPRPNVFLTSSQKLQLATINPASNTTSISRSAVLSEQDDIDNDETYQEYKEDMRRELRRDDDKAVGWMFLTMEPCFAGEVLRDLG